MRELKLTQEEVSRLTGEVRAMSDGSGALRNEHQRLQEEIIQREKEKAEGEEGGGGIGQGELRVSTKFDVWKTQGLE